MKISSAIILGMFAGLYLSESAFAQRLSQDPVIEVEQGLLKGTVRNETASFKGIPYAAPPVGNLRWHAPMPPQNWQGTKDASQFGSSCLQRKGLSSKKEIVGSEDCLTLNVWTPKNSAGASLPVMVFIHGGSFAWGSSAEEIKGVRIYDGTYLSASGSAVIVTINYRLGAFGFLAHPSLEKSAEGFVGNYGLLDQIEALKWIQTNIKSFGGDPNKVTLFGESAGGFSVLGLFVSPFAKGLFSQALVESGSVIRETKARAEKVGDLFATASGCKGTTEDSCLRAMSATQVMNVASKMLEGQGAKIIFGPYVDGNVIPDFPMKMIRENRQHNVPLIIGTNEDEMSILALPILMEDPVFLSKDYKKIVLDEFGPEMGPKVLNQYPVQKYKYPIYALKDVFNDYIFQCPANEIAEVISNRSENQNVWKYFFTHVHHNDPFALIGAGHATELFYVFNNFAKPPSIFAPNKAEMELAKQMGAYWTQFAATGTPNGNRTRVEWSPFESRNKSYIELETPVRMKNMRASENCEFWKKYDLL